jgi:hypothetical protein
MSGKETSGIWPLMKTKCRNAVLCLLPLVFVIGISEAVIRITFLAKPSLQRVPLPEEYRGLVQPDHELFWSLRPNIIQVYKGALVETNSLGLPDITLKPRVISVEGGKVQSAGLNEKSLGRREPPPCRAYG